jgi:hypothetical protein
VCVCRETNSFFFAHVAPFFSFSFLIAVVFVINFIWVLYAGDVCFFVLKK